MDENRSTIGIRADWRCAQCSHKARTYQLAQTLDGLTRLILPPSWTSVNRLTYCPACGTVRGARNSFLKPLPTT